MCVVEVNRHSNHRLLRLAAVPAAHVATDEVMVVDQTGTRYLLDGPARTLTRLSTSEAQMLAAFFDESDRTCWDTVDGLAQRLQWTTDSACAG